MSENKTPAAAETKMIQINVEITEGFANFLKDYLAFFGTKMTLEDLVAQFVYGECRRLHQDLSVFLQDKDNEHYAGWTRWLRKYHKVAETIAEYPEGLVQSIIAAEIVDEEQDSSTVKATE